MLLYAPDVIGGARVEADEAARGGRAGPRRSGAGGSTPRANPRNAAAPHRSAPGAGRSADRRSGRSAGTRTARCRDPGTRCCSRRQRPTVRSAPADWRDPRRPSARMPAASSGVRNARSLYSSGRCIGVNVRKSHVPCRSGTPQDVRGAPSCADAPAAMAAATTQAATMAPLAGAIAGGVMHRERSFPVGSDRVCLKAGERHVIPADRGVRRSPPRRTRHTCTPGSGRSAPVAGRAAWRSSTAA